MKFNIDNFNLKEDSILAQKIVSRDFSLQSPNNFKFFHNASGIYNFTNEMMTDPVYKKELLGKNRILSVIGSGDQIINSILYGSTDITAFDISRFPKYFLLLKLAAIKALTRKEFLSFFSNDGKDEELEQIYDKIANHMDEASLDFWNSLFDYFDYIEVNNSMLFISEHKDALMAILCNPYLRNDKDYYSLREKIEGVKLEFLDGDIYSLSKQEILKGVYDFANISNILVYHCNEENLSLLENIPLADLGTILGYIFYTDPKMKTDYFKENLSRELSSNIIESEVLSMKYNNGAGIVLSKKKSK